MTHQTPTLVSPAHPIYTPLQRVNFTDSLSVPADISKLFIYLFFICALINVSFYTDCLGMMEIKKGIGQTPTHWFLTKQKPLPTHWKKKKKKNIVITKFRLKEKIGPSISCSFV